MNVFSYSPPFLPHCINIMPLPPTSGVGRQGNLPQNTLVPGTQV